MCEELHDPFQDQVECARYRAERDALAQRMEEIASEIDRTFSGVEGIEDAPAMRWMRGLREALGALHSPRTSHEDIEAARWVREHGGLDEVRRDFQDAYNRRSELCASLGIDLDTGWSDAMDELDRRLMPEGMEWLVEAWPRFEDDAPLKLGDEISWKDDGGKVNSVELQDGGYFVLHAADGAEDWIHPQYFPGERVKRPAPKVPGADGAEIRVGDTVWEVETGDGYVVERIYSGTTEPDFPGHTVACRRPDDIVTHMFMPSQLTHERPDSWERLEEDARQHDIDLNDTTDDYPRMSCCRDLVRRAKALAGVSE